MRMTSSRPYLLRAVHDWIVDNGLTPQIVVNADPSAGNVQVPRQYVRDGQIVLNISATAVQGLDLGDERVEFSARFGGTPYQVVVPMGAVLGIMARETGAGMALPDDASGDAPLSEPADEQPPRPKLKIIK